MAIDIGAESGRAIFGILDDKRIYLKEIYRFPNPVLNILGSYHRNIFQLYHEIITSLIICREKEKVGSDSIGIDTLGVDYIPMHPDGYNAGYCSSGDDAGQYQNPLCAGTVGRNFVTKIKKVYLTGGNQRGDP